MARLTDQIRDRVANDPLRKVRQQQQVPEWVSGAGVWVAGGALAIAGAFVLFLGITDDGEPVATQAGQQAHAPQHEVNPYHIDTPAGNANDTPSSSASPSASSAATSSTEEESEGIDYRNSDFTSLDMVSVEVETSSLNSRIPEGALNVAKAGALATASGNWSGVPMDGSPSDNRFIGTDVDTESARLAEPVTEIQGDDTFTFIFNAEDDDGTDVEFTVTTQWVEDSYSVINF